jgi:carboxypeptidase A2
MRLLLLTALLAVGLATASAELKRYDGYQLFNIYPEGGAQTQFVLALQNDEELDFWYEGRDRLDILVPPHRVQDLNAQLSGLSIAYSVPYNNIQTGMDEELRSMANKKKLPGQAIDYENYNTLADILDELDNLAARCPSTVNCTTFSLGNSLNGNPIKGLRISQPGAGRKTIWLDATIHAREWLATATHLKITKHLVDDQNDPQVVALLNKYNFVLIPVSNPDGYLWTHTNDRLWRKNRRVNPGSNCLGVDLNRNYDQMFGNAGTVTNPCGETFRGPNAASEPETVNVQNALREQGADLLFSVHFHTYGSLWLIPWGSVNPDGSCSYAADNAEMLVVANAAANAVQATYGSTWARGNSCATIYPASGITMDYSKGVAGVKYTYTPELRGNNFVIAASNITPSFNEVWNGFHATVETIERQS